MLLSTIQLNYIASRFIVFFNGQLFSLFYSHYKCIYDKITFQVKITDILNTFDNTSDFSILYIFIFYNKYIWMKITLECFECFSYTFRFFNILYNIFVKT